MLRQTLENKKFNAPDISDVNNKLETFFIHQPFKVLSSTQSAERLRIQSKNVNQQTNSSFTSEGNPERPS